MKCSSGFLIQFSKVKGSVFHHDELSKNSIMVFHQKGNGLGRMGMGTHADCVDRELSALYSIYLERRAVSLKITLDIKCETRVRYDSCQAASRLAEIQ